MRGGRGSGSRCQVILDQPLVTRNSGFAYAGRGVVCDIFMKESLSQNGQQVKLARGRRAITPHELIRRTKGFSIGELARASGQDRSLISRVERGERQPTPTYRAAVTAALGVTESQLFPKTGGPEGVN